MTHDWTDTDKAQWHLEHGYPEILWVRERVGDEVYKRAFARNGRLPPWQSGLKRDRDFIWKDKKS